MIRVLIVDDHAMLRAGFRTILGTQPDIDVVGEAATGAEGLELAARLRPDVITMDVQMPDMDGHEVTRRLRAQAQEGVPAPWIVAVTAGAMHGDRERCLQSGMDDYLAKPLQPEALRAALERGLAARRAQAA